MQRMKAILKRDKSRGPPKYLKRNRDAEKKRKAQQGDHIQDPRDKAKYTHDRRNLNQRRRKKESRDRAQDLNVQEKYTRAMMDEPIEMYQRPRRKDMTQFLQTEDTDFEDHLGGGRYSKKRDREIYDKETETDDYQRDERRYRRSRDEPFEDQPGGRGYNEKKYQETYKIGTGMDEYETDQGRYRGRSESPWYQSEPDCSGSECSMTDYQSPGRGRADPRDSPDYSYKRQARRDKFEEMSLARLLPVDHSVYRVHEIAGGARRPKASETDYTYDTVTDSETYSDKSDYDTEIDSGVASEVTDYTRGTTPGQYKDRHRAQREGRAHRDERHRQNSKRKQRTGQFGQQHLVYVANTERLQNAFERQRGSPGKQYGGVDDSKTSRSTEIESEGSKMVFVPVIVKEDSPGLPEKREMSSEKLIVKGKEQAEKPFEENVLVYAATKIDQANIFESPAKENQNTKIHGSVVPLEQPINEQTSKEEGNNSQKMSPGLLSTQQKIDGIDPSTAKENESRKSFDSIWPIPKFINVLASQEEANISQDVNSLGSFSAQQKINENNPSHPVRKSIIYIPSILSTRSAASEAMRSVHKHDESSYNQDKKGSFDDRKSVHTKRSGNKKARRSIVEDTQNSHEMKSTHQNESALQRKHSSENPRKSHTLLRKISGTEDNYHFSKNPGKSRTLIRQISGTEGNIHSSNSNPNVGTINTKKSNTMVERTDQNLGSILKHSSPQNSPGSTKVSHRKGRESIGNISRKSTRLSKLFHRKKKKHNEGESAGESEEIKNGGSVMTFNDTSSLQEDQNTQALHLWGIDASFIIFKLFSAVRGFLGLTIHDTIINVLNNDDF